MLEQAADSDREWIEDIRKATNRFPWFDGLESHILYGEAALAIEGSLPEDFELDAKVLHRN